MIRAIAVLALAAVFAGAVVPAFAEEGPLYIRGTEVNLRDEPNGSVATVLDEGEKVYVTERRDGWCCVSVPGRSVTGWVFGDYVVQKDKAPGIVEPQLTEIVVDDSCVAVASEVNVESYGFDTQAEGDKVAPAADTKKTAAAKPQATKPKASSIAFKNEAKLTSPAKLGSTEYKPAGGHGLGTISGTNVNLRKDPSQSAKVLGKVESGDKAYVIANSDPWYLVSIPERKLKGWVFGEYVDELPRVEITGSDVRLRESPGTDAGVKDMLGKGDVFYKMDAKDGWVKVTSSASGLTGWVKGDFVKKSDGSVSRPYTVTGSDVNFRTSPEVDAEVIAKLPQGAEVAVLGRNEKWSYLWYSGHKGWMYSDYLTPAGGAPEQFNIKPSTTRKTLTWKQVGGKSIGDRLITRAQAMAGTPYVWGGESDGGVDCSGLIYKLLCDEGCDTKCLPRRASEQMAQLGLAVEKEELQPGDLVFFTTYKAGASHVGIYLGDGDFIHASSAQARVTVSNLSEGYYRERFVGARRITEDQLKQMQ